MDLCRLPMPIVASRVLVPEVVGRHEPAPWRTREVRRTPEPGRLAYARPPWMPAIGVLLDVYG